MPEESTSAVVPAPSNGELPLHAKEAARVRAINVGERIDTRLLEETTPLSTAPLTVSAGSAGCAVLFRYGVVVLFDVAPLEQARFLDDLERFVIEPVAVDEREDEQAELRAGQENERAHLAVISLRSFEVERLQIVADVLAKSVVLAHYEERIGEVFGLVEPLAHELSSGSTRRRSRELLRHIGNTLLIQTKTVGMVEIADKPELLWERPDLELLYTRLADEYELDERHHALERKLAVVEHTATTALQLLQHNSSLRVEWYIVLLIVVEIVLTLIGMFG